MFLLLFILLNGKDHGEAVTVITVTVHTGHGDESVANQEAMAEK